MLKSKTIVSIALLSLLTISMASMIPIGLSATCTLRVYAKQGGSYLAGVWISLKCDSVTMWQQTALHDGPPPYAEFTVECPATCLLDAAAVEEVGGKHYRVKAKVQSDPETEVTLHSGKIMQTPSGSAIGWVRVEWEFSVEDDTSLTVSYSRGGPEIDVLRAKVIKNPDAQLLAMQTEEGVALTDLIRTGDIEKLDGDGLTITSAAGFHMGHIGYNIRSDRDYLTPPYKCNPAAAYVLSDVNFRHACFHLYNQEEIVSSIYGYTVTAVQSMVPPAEGGWVNLDVPSHPYNPGDPTASTIYNPGTGEYADACSILRYGGYVYSVARDNWITPYDIDEDGTPSETNGDDDIPTITLWTPTYEVAPTSADHGARFTEDARAVGVSLVHEPREFDPYMDDVEIGDFDMYMVFWSLGRFPDHLYTMCHSDHDVAVVPGDYNFPGCHDDDLDDAVFTIINSLDHEEKLEAAYLAQVILYDESYPNAAFSYMQLYSRIYFNAFNEDLRGIVNSPGYGSANGWTYTNMRWAEGLERYEGGKTIIEWLWGEEPELLNPCSGSTVYAWDIMDKTLDGLLAVNPYTHEDMPWMATDWQIDAWPNQGLYNNETWMNVTFTLREDVFWQCGRPYDAYDAEFNWLFLRDNNIPRYKAMTQFLEGTDVLGNYTVRAIMNITSQFLLYDLSGTAALLPPPVWEPLDGASLTTIMQYDPTAHHENLTGMGPWFNPTEGLGNDQGFPETHLYGTGVFVFEYYDDIQLVADLHQFVGYFMTTEDTGALKAELFHEIGDVDGDGEVWGTDKTRYSIAFATLTGDDDYDEDADISGPDGVPDGRVNAWDGVLISYFFGDAKEYPVE